MYKLRTILINMTTEVRRMISFRVGHLTLRSSSDVCLTKVIGVVMSQKAKNKTPANSGA